MPRTVQDARLDSRAARWRLKQRPGPYFRSISEGHLIGYRKGATWVTPTREWSSGITGTSRRATVRTRSAKARLLSASRQTPCRFGDLKVITKT
jgi:hypothetical protein